MLLLSSGILSMLSSSWLVLWLLMELNFFTFIYINIKDHQGLKWIWPLSYLTTQAITTSVFLIWCLLKTLSFSLLLMSWTIPMMMWLKMALTPFHYWAFAHMQKMNFLTLWLFISFQKLPSLAILSSLMEEPWATQMLVMFTIIMSPLIFTLQTNLKELLFISTSVTTASSVLLIYWNMTIFWLLFILMVLVYGLMCFSFHLFSMTLISKVQMFPKILSNAISSSLSIMGFPMFSMFYCKLLLLAYLNITATALFLVYLVAAVVMMHTYLKLFIYQSMVNSLFLLNFKNKFTMKWILAITSFPLLMLI